MVYSFDLNSLTATALSGGESYQNGGGGICPWEATDNRVVDSGETSVPLYVIPIVRFAPSCDHSVRYCSNS